MNQKLTMNALGRMKPEDYANATKAGITLVLDNIRSGLNVGSIFRSADSFRVKQIICCGYTPMPPHRDVLKSALGATETVRWSHSESTEEAIEVLKRQGMKCYAVEQTAHSLALNSYLPEQEDIALVLGNEVTGVDQAVINMCHRSIEVTQFGTKHSLNVAVCAGIVLYDLYHKLEVINRAE